MRSQETLVNDITALIAERHVDALVVGRSRNLAGGDNALEAHTTEFLGSLRKFWDGPVYREDELYTSREAEQIQGRNALIDASAATLILNSYFNRIRNQKNT